MAAVCCRHCRDRAEWAHQRHGDAPPLPAPAKAAAALSPLIICVQEGLCNRLRAVLSYWCVARAVGRRLIVAWPATEFCDGAFLDLFQPLPGVRWCFEPEDLPKGTEVRQESVVYECHPEIKGTHAETAMYEHLVPLEGLAATIARRRRECGSPAYVAAHIRRTEHWTSGIPPERQTSDGSFEAFFRRHASDALYLATDNVDTQRLFSALFAASRALTLQSIQRRPRALRQTDARDAAVVDLFVCAAARVFAGSYGSSFSDTIAHLRAVGGRAHASDEHVLMGSEDSLEIVTTTRTSTLWLRSASDCLAAYTVDFLNRIDALALIVSFAALVAAASADDPDNATATSLRAFGVFLLWCRLLRVLLVSPKFGPFVLMFFRMLFGDVQSYLVLLLFVIVAFAAGWTVLLQPSQPLLAQQFGADRQWRWTRSAVAHLEASDCFDELGGADFFTTLQRLFEGALTGGDFFECARNSTAAPEAMWFMSLVFVIISSVLLLNMLIAMMAKTFDNISEAAATNYLFLFTQRTLALQKEPPTPGPLFALGLPSEAVVGLIKLWRTWKKRKAVDAAPLRPPNEPLPVHQEAPEPPPAAGRPDGEESLPAAPLPSAEESQKNIAGPAPAPAKRPSMRRLSSRKQAASAEGTTAADAAEDVDDGKAKGSKGEGKDEVKELTEKIRDYILDHQDDVAQEERWRTTMKRDMAKSARATDSQLQTILTELREQRKQIDVMRAALDERGIIANPLSA